MVSDIEVPELIRAAGDRAVEQYRAFLDKPDWSSTTRKAYRRQIEKFLGWVQLRGRTLDTVGTADRIAYADEIASRSSAHTAMVALTGVRGFFRQLSACGVLDDNPFESLRSQFRKEVDRAEPSSDSTIAKPEQEAALSDYRQFPLLALMAMLANMEEKSLEVIFQDEVTAAKLLEFVRWRDRNVCTQCGAASDDQATPTASEGGGYHCPACGCTFAVTDGTPFEGLPVALRHALFLMFSIYQSNELPTETDALARDRGLEASDVMAVRFRVEEALAREKLTAGDELRQAVARKNREMMQDEVGRDIIEYAELTACRDTLLRAKSEGCPVTGLSPGMTLDEVLADLDARIAEHDCYVITVKDGYLVSYLLETVGDETGSLSSAGHPAGE
jgi:transposase-like protein